MDSIFHKNFINNNCSSRSCKYIVYDLVKHHNNGKLNDSLIAISEDTAASASCGSMVIARNQGTVSNIQIGKLTFPYVCMGGYVCVYNCFAIS